MQWAQGLEMIGWAVVGAAAPQLIHALGDDLVTSQEWRHIISSGAIGGLITLGALARTLKRDPERVYTDRKGDPQPPADGK